jgi:hypothetical protein
MIAALFALASFARPVQVDPDRIAQALGQLASEDIAERDLATDTLVGEGPGLLTRLRRAQELAEDPELRSRLAQVALKIKHRTPLSVELLRQTRWDVDFKSPRVSSVAREIERKTGFRVRLELMGGEDVALCDMAFKGVSAETLLQVATLSVGLNWEVEDRESIVIGGSERMPSSKVPLRIIDVRELTECIADKRASTAGVSTPATPVGPMAEVAPEPALISAENLVGLIKAMTTPGSWDWEEASLSTTRGFLLVRNRRAVCEEVEKLLPELRAITLYQLQVRVTILAMKEPAAERLLDGASIQVQDLKKALSEGREVIRTAEQELTTYGDLRVQRFSGRVIPFILSYDPEGTVERGQIRDGLSVSLRAIASPDRKAVKLDLDADLCRLLGMERVATRSGDVQVPTVESAEVRVLQTLPMGQAVVVSRQPNPSGNGAEFPLLVVIVRVDLKK